MGYKIFRVQTPFDIRPAVIVVTVYPSPLTLEPRAESLLLAPGASEFKKCFAYEIGEEARVQYVTLLRYAKVEVADEKRFAEEFIEGEALQQAMIDLATTLETKCGQPGVVTVGNLKAEPSDFTVFISLFQRQGGREIIDKLTAQTQYVDFRNALRQFIVNKIRPLSPF